jgi:hypothetical protein
MNVARLTTLRRRWLPALALAAITASPSHAEQVSITAEFRPDSSYPHRNKFVNTTPPSGYCTYDPAQCEQNEIFSLQVPIQFDSRVPIMANHPSPRQGATFQVPTQWRELTVYHESTREPETVRVRIVGIGSRYVTEDVMKLVGGADDYRLAHNLLWGSSWVNAPAPCQYSGVGWYTAESYAFFWKTPSATACTKQAKFDVPWLRLDFLDFAYELETPNPLGMSSGHYTGDLTYSVGPNSDFDFGDVMMPSSSSLTLNFNLDVRHTLKVDIPPGGEKVRLVPAGGWQGWLQAGRRPVSLFRDQTFTISASSRFKMQMMCGPGLNGECAIEDAETNRRAEMFVSVSLPNGLTDLSGQPVKRLRLKSGQENALYFKPGFYVDRAPGVLHFEVPPHSMATILRPGESGSYRGTVIVIWDSDI